MEFHGWEGLHHEHFSQSIITFRFYQNNHTIIKIVCHEPNHFLKEHVMKKMSIFLVVLLTLCMVLPASAQMNLGVLGGVNLAKLSIDPEPEGVDFSNRTVFGFGGVLDYGLNESVAFHVQPMYLQKGGKVAAGNMAKAESKLAYLEIPVMLKYAFSANDIKPYIMAGPTIGFNLSSKVEYTFGDSSGEEDNKDDTKTIEFGLDFGAGVSLPLSTNFIFVEARYALGLTDLFEATDTDTKTKGIQIFAGITFPPGSK